MSSKQWPSKKPVRAAQSKRFEYGVLIRLLLMFPGNDERREKAAILKIELEARQMIGWHLVISAILTSAAVAGCITYLLGPPMASIAVDHQPYASRLSLSSPDSANSKAAGKHLIENEKAAIAYLEVAQEILRRAPLAQASASTDQLIFTARVPLPRKRPIPR
ncbi:hypothetical protein [Bradyrhizobium roseum]|uniref:hypothetical protein n=1 Tax=Bradyrhizobium roseum TaxID=3056648 RepID=UPI00262FB030|nr:hypothetical protein [Bradyrhizobium roseus]WKA30417.1 hypothetical protein QUH67_09725 [Bradyrhizobium roseus]